MTEPTIICPNCKTEIKPTESLALWAFLMPVLDAVANTRNFDHSWVMRTMVKIDDGRDTGGRATQGAVADEPMDGRGRALSGTGAEDEPLLIA